MKPQKISSLISALKHFESLGLFVPEESYFLACKLDPADIVGDDLELLAVLLYDEGIRIKNISDS